MFLHLGSDTVVRIRDLVGIFDYSPAELAGPTKEFLQLARGEGKVIDISEGQPKSFVILSDRIVFSPISSLTLKKRASFPYGTDEVGA